MQQGQGRRLWDLLKLRGGGTPEPDLIAQMEIAYGIDIHRGVGLWMFVVVLAYVVAAWTEETMKYMIPTFFKRVKFSQSK